MQGNSGEQPGLDLLSLDGDRITGLSSLLILKELRTRVQKKDRRDTVPKPCELFNMIAGTGTGAISAVMLGRLHMEIDEAIRTYTRLIKTVFSQRKYALKGDTGKFKASVLESELKRMIGLVLGDEDEKMVEEEQADEGTRCKVVVYAMSDCRGRFSELGLVYHRLNVQQGTQGVEASEWERLNEIAAHTRADLDQEEFGPQLNKLIEVILWVHCRAP